jgi:hypothetical protein
MGKSNPYEQIALKYLPHGYTVEYRKSLSGMHYGERNLIKAPRPKTAKSLLVFLHECAHAYLHTGSGKNAAPRHVQEMEAVLWSWDKMEKHNIPIPPEFIRRDKRYVARKIVQAERRGARYIDPRARAFAGEYVAELRTLYEKICGKSQHPGASLEEKGPVSA